MAQTTQKRRVIKVTRRQVKAAQDTLEADRLLGRESDPAVAMIANARKVTVGGSVVPSGGVTVQRGATREQLREQAQRDGLGGIG